MLGHVNVQTSVHVPLVLQGQGVPVILQVTQQEELAAVLGLHREDSGLLGDGQHLQIRDLADVLLQDLGIAGVGSVEPVVKAPEQGGGGFEHLVVENAEELFLQGVLGHPVVVVQPRLGPPADVHGGVDVGFGPVHDPAQLFPVVHLFKVQVFHRSTGNHQTVIILVLDLIKGGVEGVQVAGVYVLGIVAHRLKQIHLNL